MEFPLVFAHDRCKVFCLRQHMGLESSNVNCLLALLGFRSSAMETIRGRPLQTYLETRAVKQTISDISGRVS